MINWILDLPAMKVWKIPLSAELARIPCIFFSVFTSCTATLFAYLLSCFYSILDVRGVKFLFWIHSWKTIWKSWTSTFHTIFSCFFCFFMRKWWKQNLRFYGGIHCCYQGCRATGKQTMQNLHLYTIWLKGRKYFLWNLFHYKLRKVKIYFLKSVLLQTKKSENIFPEICSIIN